MVGRRGRLRIGTTLEFTLGLLVAVALFGPGTSAAQGPPDVERAAIDALLQMLEGTLDPSVFATERLTPEYRGSFDSPGLIAYLGAVRAAAEGTLGEVDVGLDPGGLVVTLRAERSVSLRLVVDPSGLISRLDVMETSAPEPEGPTAAAERHMAAIEAVGMEPAGGDRLIHDHLSPELRAQWGEDRLTAVVDSIRLIMASAGMIDFTRTPSGYAVRARGGIDADVAFEVEPDAPFSIGALEIEPAAESDGVRVGSGGAPMRPLAWDDLEARLEEAESAGFAGTVLAVRGGETVVHRGFGNADPSTGRRNDTETIFAIGSMPIDFTIAAVLLLEQDGALSLSDPVTDFFDDVPADKHDMTLAHLMTGASGLPNYHHRQGIDTDFDLSWIDRATAESRILEQRLLFAPGEGQAHSHSAFVLLAAVVERVSGGSYATFLRTRFFEPMGLQATGFFGDDLGQPLTRFAVGAGPSRVGDPNIPPNWGPTSWLVMGSGGMVSSPSDMYRWFNALRSGQILQGAALDRYLRPGVGMGQSDRGFFFLRAWGGGDDLVFVASNSGDDSPELHELARGLAALMGMELPG